MKSFLRGLKNVGKFLTSPAAIGLTQMVATIAPIPGIGMAAKFMQLAAGVEARHADNKDATGPEKAADFMNDYLDGINAANIALAIHGKKIVLDEAKIAVARDAVVAAINACRDAQESQQIVDLPE